MPNKSPVKVDSKSAPISESNQTPIVEPTGSISNVLNVWIGRIWLIGALLLSAQFILGGLLILRTVRESRPITEAKLSPVVESWLTNARRSNLAVRQSTGMESPVVVGIFRQTILLPASLPDLTETELRAILDHELAHISNRDLLWGLTYRILKIAVWPQPLFWLLRRPIAATAEELCDAKVLETGIEPESYAAILLNLQRASVSAPRFNLLAGFGIGVVNRHHPVAARIRSILSGRVASTRSPGWARFALYGAAVSSIGGVAMCVATPRPTAPSHERLKLEFAVVGPDGTPLTRAHAFLQVMGNVFEIGLNPIPVKAGRVVVDLPQTPPMTTGRLIVCAPGLGFRIMTLWPEKPTSLQLQLEPEQPVSGRLVAPDGEPAVGVKVRPYMVNLADDAQGARLYALISAAAPEELTATSDRDGRFTLGGLPKGIAITPAIDDRRYAQIGSRNETISPEKGPVPFIQIKLKGAAEVHGRITAKGKPVRGIIVGGQPDNRHYSGEWAEAITDADGRYSLVQVEAGTYNVALKLTDAQQANFTAPAHEGVILSEGATLNGVDFDLGQGAVIEGIVYDATGRPVPNASIGIYGPAHPRSGAWVQSVVTDKNGHYGLRVPDGVQHIYRMDSEPLSSGRDVTLKDGTTTRLDFR